MKILVNRVLIVINHQIMIIFRYVFFWTSHPRRINYYFHPSMRIDVTYFTFIIISSKLLSFIKYSFRQIYSQLNGL